MITRITPCHSLPRQYHAKSRTKSMLNSMSPRPLSHQSALVVENNLAMYKIRTETTNHTPRIRFTCIVHLRVVPGRVTVHGTSK